ncbi:MAG TPA: IS21-like element helper ATPase IstB [Gemmatimonadales bacterium]|nr:IS21-like element helper ATPase IstB [Gemmatimonadales bacterium]
MSKTPKAPPLEVDGTREKLLRLGLGHAAEALVAELTEAAQHDRSAHQVLDRLLTLELSQRDERRIRTSLRLSGLPPGMTLGEFDFAFQPSVERRQIETLATCAFIREHATLLIQGPPGVGKTHLCAGLGVKAIEHGFSVAFYVLEDLLHEMRKDAAVAPQRLRRKKYFNVSYLVVDEVGFEPMSREDASLFFRLVSYRYCRGSTAITTNKSVKGWPGIFAGDEALAAAILDRLLHRSVVLNIRGRSYRLQELEKLLK